VDVYAMDDNLHPHDLDPKHPMIGDEHGHDNKGGEPK
jgi:hypothetical protein